MIKAVLFDLDGTLLDTEPDFTAILNDMLGKHGHEAVDSALVRKFVSAGALSVVRQGFNIAEDHPSAQELLKDFLERYSQQIPQTRAALFKDIDFALSALREQGLPWGIMTNKARRFSEPLLKQFQSLSTCSTLVCPDDPGSKGKPDPAGLLLACTALKQPPANVLYVGDHPRDIEAARNAGMPAVAVSWGYLPDELHISKWGAHFIADTPRLLLSQIAQYGK
ncbi:MAG: hypothetical protein RLZZ227_2954 [Pseudomonadota bacterium]